MGWGLTPVTSVPSAAFEGVSRDPNVAGNVKNSQRRQHWPQEPINIISNV